MESDRNSDFELPDRGFVFWPVGTGDSTTVVVDEQHTLQVDIRQMEQSADDDDPHCPVVDELTKTLPSKKGRPYLSTFVLTHPDKDHCQGFEDLLKRVDIGEIWLAPRVLSEFDDELCDDAKAFQKEASRRIKKAIKGEQDSGDRVRIIGYAEILEDEEFEGFPDDLLTVPGNKIVEIDGDDLSDIFRAFVHAPFKDDAEAERNDTSIALQIALAQDDTICRAMLMGDLSNPTINRIYESSDDENVEWNIFLAPHHCSKSVMYVNDSDGEDKLDDELMSKIELAGAGQRYVVSSSEPIPESNDPGDNPPHAIAKNRYLEIVEADNFICTQEHPSESEPEPIVVSVNADGIELVDFVNADTAESSDLQNAVAKARGGGPPPAQLVGFGGE